MELNPVLDELRARGRGADRQPHGRPARARDRADRPGLPAGRPREGELEGISGGRGGGAARWRASSRSWRRGRERGAGSRARVLGSRRRGGAAQRGAHAVVPHARARELASARSTRSRSRRRSSSRPSERPHDDATQRAAARRVRRARALGRHRPGRAVGQARGAGAELHRLHPVRAPGAVLHGPRAGHHALPRGGARRARAAGLPLQRLGDLRGGRRPDPGDPRALARVGPVPAADRDLAQGVRRRRARARGRRTRSWSCAATRRARAATPRTRRSWTSSSGARAEAG